MTSELPWNAQTLESAARTIGVNRSNLSSALGAESAPTLPFLPGFRKQGIRPVAAVLMAARMLDMGTHAPTEIFPTTVEDPPPELRVDLLAHILRLLLATDNALVEAPENPQVIEAASELAAIAAVALVNALPAAMRERLPEDVLDQVTTWLADSEDDDESE